MLDNLTKPNLIGVFGLAVAAAVLPELVPEWRPALKSVLKFGVTLLCESQEEAEAELIQSLVVTTIEAIREELATPAGEAERRAAVQHKIRHFKHRARRRSRRWDGDEDGEGRFYRRHVKRLEAALADQEQQVAPGDRPVIAEAAAHLAQG